MVNHPDSDYFTADDLARIYQLSRARIYRLAHDHLWRRRRINSQTRYDIRDAHDTLRTEVVDITKSAEDPVHSVGSIRPQH